MSLSSTSDLPFLSLRPDSGQYTYFRRMRPEVAHLIVGEIDRSWSGKRHYLDGKKAIKISLKTTDANDARSRWASIHAQVEALYRLALIQIGTTYRRKDAGMQHVGTLSDADKRAIAEQVRHDILADDDRSWMNSKHSNGTTKAIQLAGRGTVSAQLAANLAREIEANVVDHALRTRDLGILETITRKVDDADAARALLQRIAAAASAGLTPEAADIAALNNLPRTTVSSGELSERLAENGITMPADNHDRRHLGLMLLRAASQAHRDVEQRLTGSNIETPTRPPLLIDIKEQQSASSPRMSDVFNTWVRLKRPAAKTRAHNNLYLQRFIAVHGDLPVASVTREQIRTFRDLIERFPRNVPPALEGATPNDIAAWAQANLGVRMISRTTVNNRAIGALSTLFDTALREALIESNPCSRLRLPMKASDRKEVAPFSIEELNLIFSAPEITGTPRYAKASGGEAARWLPLIGLFTGARMEEIAQLHVTDIIKMDDFHAFRITTDTNDDLPPARKAIGGEEKSLKNASAHRIVPIHETLLVNGLLEYVEARRKAGNRRLFPLVTARGDRCAKNWSRWFARFIDKRVTTSASKNFHSFRHTFIDGMRDSLVGRDVIKAIVGHANSDVTDGYGQGCSPRTMHTELKKLEYRGLILGY